MFRYITQTILKVCAKRSSTSTMTLSLFGILQQGPAATGEKDTIFFETIHCDIMMLTAALSVFWCQAGG